MDPETVERLRTDDTELMLFSFKYLASTLFGTLDLTICQEKVASKAAELKKNQEEAVRRAEQEYRELKAERDHMLAKRDKTGPKA